MERISNFINEIIEKIMVKMSKTQPKINNTKSDLNKLRNRVEILDEKKGVDSGFLENFNNKYFPAYNIEDIIESFEDKNEDRTNYVVRKEKEDNVMVYEYDMDNYKDKKEDSTILYDNDESLIVKDASTGKNYVYDKPTKQLLEYEKNTNMDNVNKLKYLEKRLKKLEMVNDRNSVKIDFSDRDNVAEKLFKPTEIEVNEEDLNLEYKIDSQKLIKGYNYTFSLLFKRLKEIGFNEKTINKIFIDIGYNLTRANGILNELSIIENIESQIEKASQYIKQKSDVQQEITETNETNETNETSEINGIESESEDPDKELIDSINSFEKKDSNKMSSIIYLIISLIIIFFVFYIINKLRKSSKTKLLKVVTIDRGI